MAVIKTVNSKMASTNNAFSL